MTEREMMLTALLGCRRIDLYTDPPRLTFAQEAALADMEQQRREGVPLQYILGQSDFMGLTLKVDPRVLIPRPETEILIDEALRLARRENSRDLRVLDLGTGSGNIAVSMACFLDTCSVEAVDISAEALEVAEQNALRHGVADRIKFSRCDMFDRLRQTTAGAAFGMVISNPPYIAAGALGSLPADVQREPRAALDGGEDGLKFLRFIIENSSAHLESGGFLLLEIGDAQRNFLEKCLDKSGQFCDYVFVPDYVMTDRVLLARKKIL